MISTYIIKTVNGLDSSNNICKAYYTKNQLCIDQLEKNFMLPMDAVDDYARQLVKREPNEPEIDNLYA